VFSCSSVRIKFSCSVKLALVRDGVCFKRLRFRKETVGTYLLHLKLPAKNPRSRYP
jgi:hypothetical protein